MRKFAFDDSSNIQFTGELFFNIYKNAEFLRHEDNVVTILSKGYQLRQALKGVGQGEKVTMQGMWLTTSRDIPLLVKKSGPQVIIQNHEFTANRLTGLTAAFAFEQRSRYPRLTAAEATPLGIEWDNQDVAVSRLYLATVSGAEHFYEQFSFWPLLCALKKLQLKRITLEPVLKMAKIKNNKGVRLCDDMNRQCAVACTLWSLFKVEKTDLKKTLRTFPTAIRDLFA